MLVETALGYLFPGPGRLLDPFLLIVVYCALSGGETHGMLAGVGAGWVQDALFGGRVLGLSALSKLLVGFAVGLAGGRFLISGTAARALAVFVATLADGLLVPWLASVFTLEVLPQGPARAARPRGLERAGRRRAVRAGRAPAAAGSIVSGVAS